MKTKYERMKKQEKKELLEKYKKTEAGKAQISRLQRINVIGILCVLYGVFLILSESKNLNAWIILATIIMVIIGYIFLIASYNLKKKSLNTFAIKGK